jgi:O-antigen/teichoic acid export membrane protein
MVSGTVTSMPRGGASVPVTIDGLAVVTPPVDTSERPSLARAGAVVAVAMGAGNVANYAFHVLMARRLGPSAYGSLGALLGLSLIVSVPAMALQISIARHTALLRAAGTDRTELWGGFFRVTVVLGLATAATAAVASPLLVTFLHLDGTAAALWMAASIAPLPAVAGMAGMLQGEERFVAMSTVLLVPIAVKVVLALVLVGIGYGVSGALAAAAAGAAAGAGAGMVVVRPPVTGRFDPGVRSDLVKVLAAGLALFLLSNLDLLLARHYLGRRSSGLYAAGALVAKVAFWGPQFVTAVVFPRLTDSAERRRLLGRALAVVAACCIVGVVALAVAARPFLGSVFGSDYEGLGTTLWVFGALGTALALVQVVMFSAISAGDARMALAMWLTVVVEACLIVVFHRSIAQVAGVALGSVAVLLVVGLAVEQRRDGGREPVEPWPAPVP